MMLQDPQRTANLVSKDRQLMVGRFNERVAAYYA
jgi:hypothetical protein